MADLSPAIEALMQELAACFHADEAAGVRAVLQRSQELRAMIDAPVNSFDSPAIIHVRSRAMLDALLEAGADINARSRWWAGSFGILDTVEPAIAMYAIERGARVDAHAAARLGLMDRLREIVARQPDAVHAPGGDGKTPLHFAGSVEAAAHLLDAGANIDALDVDHESTPAQYMADDRQDVARFLVSRGCRTDLLLASALGDADAARRHLDADPETIRMRVNAHWFPMANPKAGGTIYNWSLGSHMSPHEAARKFRQEGVLSLLLERSPADVQLADACMAGDAARARAIHDANPGVANSLSKADRSLVAHAARNNETTAVRLMLEWGWPVDAKGQHQATPLHWAAFHGNAEMVAAILFFSPPLETTDADFNGTPMGWAIHGSENSWQSGTGDYAGTVAALLEAGAKRPDVISGSEAVRRALSSAGL